jgi:alpha-L-rhamnosidase
MLLLVCSYCSAAGLIPTNLICEYSHNPLGVDIPRPRLSWIDTTDEFLAHGIRQSAYQIAVAASLADLKNGKNLLWSTGVVKSSSSRWIAYSGKDLETAQLVFWKVRFWDQVGHVSTWSEPASWTMGIMQPSEWKANWISLYQSNTPGIRAIGDHANETANTDSTLLRKQIIVKRGLARALAYVCGLGQYEMQVNGHKAGDDVLSPGWTKYDKTCLYDTRDIGSLLHPGLNVIGLILGNGMYNVHGGRYTKFTGSFGPQKAICELILLYRDGSKEVYGTDSTWTAAPGPITFSSIYGGEDYDARLAMRGWDKQGFDDSGWQNAIITSGPGGTLRGLSCAAPPIIVAQVINPVSVTRLSATSSVYDFGQNADFMPKLTVTGSEGSVVTMTPAELINADGTADRESVGGGEAYWKYTLDGSGEQSYMPKFFYQGCRYLQVDLNAAPGHSQPVVRSLIGNVVGSSSDSVGNFHCSNDLFNKTYNLIRWAQRSNSVSILTDCPTRERLGWLEEDHLNGPALRYNFNLDQLFHKISHDIDDSQTPDGLVPSIAPEYPVFSGGFRDSPEWGSAVLLIPWQQYEFAGDKSLLIGNYKAMKKYVDYLTSKSKNNTVDYGLGDWYYIGGDFTPPALTATAFYYQDLVVLAKTADILGFSDDQAVYSALASKVKESFISKFWNAATSSFASNSQTGDALPVVMGLTPDGAKASVVATIVKDISDRGMSFTSGDIGYRYLLKSLADNGRSNVIFAMNNQSDKPGYGYQLKMGATSLTEAWDAARSSSQNHFMLGQINEWFYHDLAGIQDDPASPGFTKIIIKPTPVGDITSVRASYNSAAGLIVSDWALVDGQFHLSLTIPVNTTATVFVPSDGGIITESGNPVSDDQHVQFLRKGDNYSVYNVGSGHYDFGSHYLVKEMAP